ncbi:MAG: universal stress protein [Bdellovibrionaceae bacterium]|jgi:nucleotide-binding universal stress UspA family protein|nr:universal stress protein [Pseudobdellovibrionaceae bacterium]
MKQKMKIRWAFDPFTKQENTWHRAVEFLYNMQDSKEAEVIPTYVMGSEVSDWVTKSMAYEGVDMYHTISEVCLAKLKELDTRESFNAPEIIESSTGSKRSDASIMAKSLDGIDLLVVNTHAQKGLERFFIGSFAENLLLQCSTPMAFISPHTDKVNALNKGLYPTDLLASSKPVFDDYLEQSFNTAKQVVLYSKYFHPETSFYSSTSVMLGGGPISLNQYYEDQSLNKEKQAAHWQDSAKSLDIKTEVILDDSAHPMAESIVNTAKENNCDLIYMPSFSSTMDTVLVGSIAREVIRQSPLPVIVWHIS